MPDPRDDDEDLETLAGGGGGAQSGPKTPSADSSDTSAEDQATLAPESPSRTEAPTGEVPALDLESIAIPSRRATGSTSRGGAAGRGTPRPPGITRPPATPTVPAEGVGDDGAGGSAEDRATLAPTPSAPEPTPDDDRETLVSGAHAGLPASEIEPERNVGTEAGGFGTDVSRRGNTVSETRPDTTPARDDPEGATVVDAGLTDRQKALFGESSKAPSSSGMPHPTVADRAAGSATQRSQGPVPASKYSRGTARDPVVGTGAGRGTVGSGRAAPTILQEGQLIADRYELVRRLGKGGMGEVWQAKHTLLQGMRAIKVIKASISRDPSFRARFLSEGQTMMRVKHEGVVEVTDLDETRANRELFMVMEYLQGRTMHDAVRDEVKPLCADVRDAIRIYRALALGMQRIHDERIVHKDLKTDNVVLVKDAQGLEHPKVIDFGLAKRLEDKTEVPVAVGAADSIREGSNADLHTTLSGTLAYMAPEQFRGEASSFQSDIYSFGVMVYECFTKGEYPMPRGSLIEYMERHNDGKPPRQLAQARPDLDREMADLTDRCMAPTREARPASFTEIAEEMRLWLEAPERAARRKARILQVSGVSALVAVAVWGVFFQTGPAGVSNLTLARAGGGGDFQIRGERHYLPDGVLSDLVVSGEVSDGDVGTPSILVDGVQHAADLKIAAGADGKRKLAGSIDLNDLADGEHVLGFRAASGSDPARMRIVVDRKPPAISSVTVAGGRGIYTNDELPKLWVHVDDAQTELQSVQVTVPRSRETKSADRSADDPNRWTIQGVHDGDGEQTVQVRATDLAGNVTRTPFEFKFVRDTRAEEFDVAGLAATETVLQTREPSGNRLTVSSTEDVELKASFLRAGDRVPEERTFPFARQFDVPLRDIPVGGLAVTLTTTDRAGNESKREFGAKLVLDEATIEPADGRSAVRPGDAVVLKLHRSYPLPATTKLTAARVLEADGSPARDASPIALVGAGIEFDAKRPGEAVARLTADLAPGVYGLGIDGLGAARVAPLQMVVDPVPPRFTSIVVKDAQGRVVPTGGWCLTQDATVEVEMEELAPASIALEAAPPEQAPQAGRSRSVFRHRFAAQGANTLNLAARDRSGNDSLPTTVVVNADWTAPTLDLASPLAGDKIDDVTPVVFTGRCSEDAFTLVVTGLAGPLQRDFATASFSGQWTLPKGDHTLVVQALDPAGHASAPVTLAVHVDHVAVERKPQITWTKGANVEMRKVDRGDVLIDRLTQPVALVYVDLTEVTNRQYRLFLEACAAQKGARCPWDHADQPASWSHVPTAETWNDPKWNSDDLPVVNVAWWDAVAFASWSGRRLPSEGEWVKAAAKSDGERGLRAWPPIPQGTPWKEGLLATEEMTKQKGPVDATKGGDVSPAGCLHMGGNVSEWVDLPFAKDGDPKTGVRGGSFWSSKFGADIAGVPTKPYDRSFRAKTIGFRCAIDASEVSQ
ncbi:MAG: protein kinase [Planctomycetes bacterium]|nr:protein kinase [Planctomycetota bacterium]